MRIAIGKILCFTLLSSSLISCALNASSITNVYSDLSGDKCTQRILEEVTGSAADLCPGPAGYMLDVLYDDDRVSINVISPEKKEYKLDYWTIVSPGFSSFEGSAEWVIKQQKDSVIPIALVVKMNTIENDEPNTSKSTLYFVISKITPEIVCITDKVIATSPDARSNVEKLANLATSKECLAVN